MPRRDGTGPAGQGPGTGRGMGGGGQGAGRGQKGGNRAGKGPGGFCLCPNCGEKVNHQVGKPCYEMLCPKCGALLIRE
jgi:hypothetical protein